MSADPADDDSEVVELGRREYRVPAAEKALDILEFMAAQQQDVTQTEISNGLGRSIHEIYRIIQLLERRGFLIRSNADRYRLSLRLFELAHMHPPVNRLIDSALPVMRSLVGNIDQSCHLAVMRGLEVLIVLQVDSPMPMRYSMALGSHLPLLETSSGAVLLAALPPGERDALITQMIDAGDGDARREAIEARLRNIAELGYEMCPSLVIESCTNISLPIRDHTGASVAALTVPYVPQKYVRFSPQAVLRTVQAAAQEISRALGAPDPAGNVPPVRQDAADTRRRHRPRLATTITQGRTS
jgi:DNA-binding IclR family transcriptional regulator